MSGIGSARSSLAIGFCFPIITAILIFLRLFTRRRQKADLAFDDWLTLPAWLCVTGNAVTILIGVFKHTFDTSAAGAADEPGAVSPQERLLAQLTAANVIFFLYGNTCIKLSVLLFYRRIFFGTAFKICNWILIGLTALFFIEGHFSIFLFCGFNVKEDFEGGWAICPSWGSRIQVAGFAFDTFVDFLILALPVPFVSRLQLDTKRKIGVVIVFLLGGFAFVASLFNAIITIVSLTNPTLVEDDTGENLYQGSSYLYVNWPAVEIGVGLIACNIPVLSFRLTNWLPSSLRDFKTSWSDIRHAAAVITLRSRSSENPRSELTTRNATSGASQTQDAARALSVGLTGGSFGRSVISNPERLGRQTSSDFELNALTKVQDCGKGAAREQQRGYKV